MDTVSPTTNLPKNTQQTLPGMMRLCGRVLSDGSVCKRPNGHDCACEIFVDRKRKRTQCTAVEEKMVLEKPVWNPGRVTCSPRIGDEYQAIIPVYQGPYAYTI